MASNSFGTLFRITTFGESHGVAIGVVVDGCPSGLELEEAEIQKELQLRRPGASIYTSPRRESDVVEILSGLFEGKTTGAPIALLIRNEDADVRAYAPMQDLLRPGHANFTYLEKYGCFDYRGGGRASGRETAARVAAGAIAKKLLRREGIECFASLKELGGIVARGGSREQVVRSPLFCGDEEAERAMVRSLEELQREGDSVGGIVECVGLGLPVGLGDPVYEKLEANLAKAMLTIPATKGVEFGAGFQAARMRGSEHNDAFIVDGGRVTMATNHGGGTLGGISSGMPLLFRVAFKPTSSIRKPQQTVDLEGKACTLSLPEGSRHDPCVAIRGVPVVEAMAALVLVDALLANRLCI